MIASCDFYICIYSHSENIIHGSLPHRCICTLPHRPAQWTQVGGVGPVNVTRLKCLAVKPREVSRKHCTGVLSFSHSESSRKKISSYKTNILVSLCKQSHVYGIALSWLVGCLKTEPPCVALSGLGTWHEAWAGVCLLNLLPHPPVWYDHRCSQPWQQWAILSGPQMKILLKRAGTQAVTEIIPSPLNFCLLKWGPRVTEHGEIKSPRKMTTRWETQGKSLDHLLGWEWRIAMFG